MKPAQNTSRIAEVGVACSLVAVVVLTIGDHSLVHRPENRNRFSESTMRRLKDALWVRPLVGEPGVSRKPKWLVQHEGDTHVTGRHHPRPTVRA
jgi:hypothetical protein